MTILIVLLGVLTILVLIHLFVVKESFQNIQLDPDVIQGYNNFLSFYNSFCPNWQKAIISSIAADTPQEPLTSPSQANTGTAPTPSEQEQNSYIQKLSIILNQKFPPICIDLPQQIDSNTLPQIIQQIPTDPQPYMNALTWMNSQLSKAHSNLNSALQGQQTEGFDDMCQDISQCIANNPQLAQQIAQQMVQQQQESIQQQEQEVITKVTPFISMPGLAQALAENLDLVKKSQDIQNQAQSGQLLNQVNVPGSDSQITYNTPNGGDSLSKMKENDPNKYNDLQKNYSQWFAVKSLMEQINSTINR